MELNFAVNVIKKEYEKNKGLDLDKMTDGLQFLIALNKVEKSLEDGSLKESEYVLSVTGKKPRGTTKNKKNVKRKTLKKTNKARR
jgi:hypothetical protein